MDISQCLERVFTESCSSTSPCEIFLQPFHFLHPGFPFKMVPEPCSSLALPRTPSCHTCPSCDPPQVFSLLPSWIQQPVHSSISNTSSLSWDPAFPVYLKGPHLATPPPQASSPSSPRLHQAHVPPPPQSGIFHCPCHSPLTRSLLFLTVISTPVSLPHSSPF